MVIQINQGYSEPPLRKRDGEPVVNDLVLKKLEDLGFDAKVARDSILERERNQLTALYRLLAETNHNDPNDSDQQPEKANQLDDTAAEMISVEVM